MLSLFMIDTHCHLEQPDYDKDREEVIKRCRNQLQAVITSCVNPRYFKLTLQLVQQYKDFVFATAGIHPSYIKTFSHGKIREYVDWITSKKDSIVAIGETGLDYSWVKETNWRKKQKKLFERLIEIANQLHLPLVIHSRDATEDAIAILEQHADEYVQMHMFTNYSCLKRVVDNGWLISVNTLLLRSKGIKKIVRDCPLEQLMLETDSPWLGIGEDGNIKPKDVVRNEPIAVCLVGKKIAEIKKMDINQVDEQITDNAVKFFNL